MNANSSNSRRRILVVYGTRPEAIKMAPVVAAMSRSSSLAPIVAVTGQHREMLDQVNSLFEIEPAHDLNIISGRQSLADITIRVLEGVGRIIEEESPDAILVQGDTTTCFATALAGFYQRIPVLHLEAGLRTGEMYDPYPEEMNRRLATDLCSLHLAPTQEARQNLLNDGVGPQAIHVTGNTVIDALFEVVSKRRPSRILHRFEGQRMILVTSHRRESWGPPMSRVARAISTVARSFPDVVVLLPAHLNPAVREVLLPPLENLHNVVVTEPLSYADFASAMAASTIILTDSGGVQEEAPSLGKPVLVLRDTTERPEAVRAGTVRLVGTNESAIVDGVSRLLNDPNEYARMARAVNPYGDGHASDRVTQSIEHYFGLAQCPDDFDPAGQCV